MKPDYLRQLDILNPNKIQWPVTLIGCGGIGSILAVLLAKMGVPKMILIDSDNIEAHNLPNQFFPLEDLDKPKVESLANFVKKLAPVEIVPLQEKFTKDSKAEGIVISGVDSMTSRQEIWKVLKWKTQVPVYLDARLGGEVVEVFTIRPYQLEDVKFYEKFLFNDSEGEELPCTRQNIMYSGFAIAALAANQLKKWILGSKYDPRVVFDLSTLTLLTGGNK